MLWLVFFVFFKVPGKRVPELKINIFYAWTLGSRIITRPNKNWKKKKGQNPHLSSRFAAAVLPPLLEAGVPVRPDDAVVQPRAINEAHGVFCP